MYSFIKNIIFWNSFWIPLNSMYPLTYCYLLNSTVLGSITNKYCSKVFINSVSLSANPDSNLRKYIGTVMKLKYMLFHFTMRCSVLKLNVWYSYSSFTRAFKRIPSYYDLWWGFVRSEFYWRFVIRNKLKYVIYILYVRYNRLIVEFNVRSNHPLSKRDAQMGKLFKKIVQFWI